MRKHFMEIIIPAAMAGFLAFMLFFRSFYMPALFYILIFGVVERALAAITSLVVPAVIVRDDEVTVNSWYGLSSKKYAVRGIMDLRLLEGQLFRRNRETDKWDRLTTFGRWGLHPPDVTRLEKEIDHFRRQAAAARGRKIIEEESGARDADNPFG